MRKLRRFDTFIDEIHEANGVEAGIEAIHQFHPDVVFLDVEMDDGTGFELIQKLEIVSFQLVFVTAYDKYAMEAFKQNAIDFLLKPVDTDDLLVTLQKVAKAIQGNQIAQQLESLKRTMIELNPHNQRIVLKDIKSIYFVKINDIIYCESDGSYTTFHLEDKKKITVSRILKEYETLLEPLGFLRTHNSFLVNLSRIERLDKTNSISLVLDNGNEVPVSQRKLEQVLKILSR